MISIRGVGFSYPDAIINAGFLKQLGFSDVAGRLGIRERRTSLTLPYILETRNKVPGDGFKNSMTPTELASTAALSALEAAGASKDDLSLIVGNGETPRETTPSEGQRVGKVLGLKVPAYDIGITPLTLIAHLDVLNNWKEERLPTNTLSVSAATLTAVVDYTDMDSALRFGDGAGAAVISSLPGKLRVLETAFRAVSHPDSIVSLSAYSHIKISENESIRRSAISKSAELIAAANSRHGFNWKEDRLILDQVDRSFINDVVAGLRIPESALWCIGDRFGDTGGAGLYGALALNWNKISPGQKIAMVSSIGGYCWGSVILQGN